MATIFSHKGISIILTEEQLTVVHYSKSSNEKKAHVFDIETLLILLDNLTKIEQLEGKPSNLKTK